MKGLADMVGGKVKKMPDDYGAPDDEAAEPAAPEAAAGGGDPIAAAGDMMAEMVEAGEMSGSPLDGPEITFDTADFPKLAEDEIGSTVVAVVCGEVTAADDGSVVVKIKDASVVHGKKSMALGGGGRFAKLEGELSHRPGVRNPAGLAAAIGRKKYGSGKMAAMAAHGRERSMD